MANVLVNDSYLRNIATAIRDVARTEDKYTVGQMAAAVRQIGNNLGTKEVTANGRYTAAREGYGGYSSVVVNVPPMYGGDILYGTSEPSANVGNNGNVYVHYAYFGGAGERTYDLNITGGLRGSSSLAYVGSNDLNLFFDDGNGNEVSIRDIADFTYSSNRSTPTAAFNTSLTDYWEANPLPVHVYMTATIPAGYTPKVLQSYQRSGSYSTDVWSSFTLTETFGTKSRVIADYSGLTVASWAGAGNPTRFDLIADQYAVLGTYVKIDGVWVEINKINVDIVLDSE